MAVLFERYGIGEENAAERQPPIRRWESDEPSAPVAEVTDDSSPETPETQRRLPVVSKPMKAHSMQWRADIFHCYHREGTAPLRLPEVSPATIAAACYITPASEPEGEMELPTVHICDKDRRVLCVLPYYIVSAEQSANTGFVRLFFLCRKRDQFSSAPVIRLNIICHAWPWGCRWTSLCAAARRAMVVCFSRHTSRRRPP